MRERPFACDDIVEVVEHGHKRRYETPSTLSVVGEVGERAGDPSVTRFGCGDLDTQNHIVPTCSHDLADELFDEYPRPFAIQHKNRQAIAFVRELLNEALRYSCENVDGGAVDRHGSFVTSAHGGEQRFRSIATNRFEVLADAADQGGCGYWAETLKAVEEQIGVRVVQTELIVEGGNEQLTNLLKVVGKPTKSDRVDPEHKAPGTHLDDIHRGELFDDRVRGCIGDPLGNQLYDRRLVRLNVGEDVNCLEPAGSDSLEELSSGVFQFSGR